ncbi:MAG: hypothetical protein HQM03_21655 [Magnetococcales bacterium]|nr:hypothetical protein [Magnetococcales bacterium]
MDDKILFPKLDGHATVDGISVAFAVANAHTPDHLCRAEQFGHGCVSGEIPDQPTMGTIAHHMLTVVKFDLKALSFCQNLGHSGHFAGVPLFVKQGIPNA